ncbi:MAG: CRISPR-associated protein Cas5 [candidate division WOR-3 bacterium]
MKVLELKVHGLVSSFRRPMDHNYQKTFPLPPPTTLLGLAGAALGLSPEEMWRDGSKIRCLKSTVIADRPPGVAKDLWKIMKIEGTKIKTRSIYTRELLFFPAYTILYAGAPELLEELKEAFDDPAYSLSLGREDELIAIIKNCFVEATPTPPEFSGTFIPVDIHTIPEEKIKLILDQEGFFSLPQSVKLPVSFKINKGIREPEKELYFTFIPKGLKMFVEGLEAFQTDGRAFCFWP